MKNKIVHILLLVAVLLAFAYVYLVLGMDIDDILGLLPDSNLYMFIGLMVLFCIKGAIIVVPRTALYIATALIFPIGWAIVVCALGVLCEMAMGYLNGMRLGSEKMESLLEKNKRLKEYLAKKGSIDTAGYFMLRLVPVPFDIVSMVCGAARVKFVRFAVFSLLGAMVRLVPFLLVVQHVASLS